MEKFKVNGDKNIKHANIKAKLGITNKKNHNVFYMEGGAFITPEHEYSDFNEIMNKISSNCKRIIKNKLYNNSALSPDFLMNFEICSDRMMKNKKSYLSFQYHFKQKNLMNNSIINIKNENESFFIDLLNDIEKELSFYNIKMSKKRKI